MKKEVFLAVFLGITLGFVITFGIWKARSALKNLPPTQTASNSTTAPNGKPSPMAESTTANSPKLIIIQPKDNDLINSEKILVTGETLPQSTIVIIFEGGQTNAISDQKGKFSVEITLTGGINTLSIYAFDEAGNEAHEELTVIYSTAQI